MNILKRRSKYNDFDKGVTFIHESFIHAYSHASNWINGVRTPGDIIKSFEKPGSNNQHDAIKDSRESFNNTYYGTAGFQLIKEFSKRLGFNFSDQQVYEYMVDFIR